jgi:S-(hydroxymethyl)glutathione dehydrogenase/alcohol dehydrogenase
MRAAVLHELEQPLQIEDVDIDAPGPEEVLIRTASSGLCHSDLGLMDGDMPGFSDLPMVLGHESAGTVEAVGSNVTYVKPGDRVMTHVNEFCGGCDWCLSGRSHMCHHGATGKSFVKRGPEEPSRLTLGGERIGALADIGGFAEQILIHQNALAKLDDDIPFEIAAILGCGVTTGFGAVLNTAQVRPGATAAVLGCGGVGLAAIQGCRVAGAVQIIAVDMVPERLELARKLGATHTVNVSEVDDPVAAVQELSGGGVEYSFDTAGGRTTTAQAFSMILPGGTCTAVGVILGYTLEIPGALLQMERKLQGCIMGSSNFRVDLPRWFELYRQDRLQLDDFVSSHIALDEINEGFDQMRRGEGARSVIDFG